MYHVIVCLVMNLVDRSLQKQLPNNALLMISASLGVVGYECGRVML